MTEAPDELPSPLVTQELTEVLRKVRELTGTGPSSPPETRKLNRDVTRALDQLENLVSMPTTPTPTPTED